MAKFIIQGGKPLRGTVLLGGAKNASFKLMIASLLASGESRLLNLARIGDVELTKEIILALGGKVVQAGQKVLVNPNQISRFAIPSSLGQKSRASIMFAGPLLARFGQAIVPFPGGDQIGARPVERHLEGLKALGAKVKCLKGMVELSCPRLKGTRYRFKKNTHTGTENLLMAAVLAQGVTILENASLEPEVDDLISFLNKMGAKIKRLPNRKIKIEGVKRLKGTSHQIMPDRNEAVSFACAALGTKGEIIIKNAEEKHLAAFLEKVKQAGGKYQVAKTAIRFWYEKPLKATNVTTRPYPGFMTDWQPLWTVLMTQAQGESRLIETVHNNRLGFTKEIVKMGAKIKLFNPQVADPDKFYNFNLEDDRPEYFHAALIQGPTSLQGAKISVPDIRAGATLTLAALIAQGQSVLTGVEHIDRGYEDLDRRLRKLGAAIRRTI
jgi:UDP-N-acetylglucosamine 1-carboxyvinyltransferase